MRHVSFLAVGLALSVVPTAQTAQVRRFAPDGITDHDYLGYALAIDGDRALISAPFQVEGTAFLFERVDDRWKQVLQVFPREGGGDFGTSLALHGDHFFLQEERLFEDRRVTLVYRRDGDDWPLVQELVGDFPGESLGFSMAVDGDRAAFGAPYAAEQPAVYVHELDASGQWVRVARLTPWPAFEDASFGASVALEGDRLLVGAPTSSQAGTSTGLAHLFERVADGTWNQRAVLQASDAQAPGFGGRADDFGRSVALRSDVALVGAPGGNGGAEDSGTVFRFEHAPDGTWTEVGRLASVDGAQGDGFGSSLALSGSRLLVGAPTDNHGLPLGDGHNVGSAYLFELEGESIGRPLAILQASDAGREDRFGSAVALDDRCALVGAARADLVGADSGTALLFDLEPLSPDTATLSVSAGGAQRLELDAGEPNAGRAYQVLGSLAGTEPGIALPGGFTLPLVLDRYLLQTLLHPGSGPVQGASGVLDAHGHAEAAVVVPPGSPLVLVGLTVNHAFVVLESAGGRRVRFVSNAAALTLVP